MKSTFPELLKFIFGLTVAPEEVEIEVCELVIFVVPPIKALPVIPNPPAITTEPVEVEDEFIDPLPN